MLKRFKKYANAIFQCCFGYKTTQPVLIIESDDWGSIRSNLAGIKRAEENGISLKEDIFCAFDTIENADDIKLIIEKFHVIKDCYGDPLILTANFLTQNPNLKKISEENFEKYYSESIIDSYIKNNCGDVLKFVKEGMDKGVIMPQLHGREHLNVPNWMKDLKKDSYRSKELVKFGIVSSPLSKNISNKFCYEDALNYNKGHIDYCYKYVDEAYKDFYDLFGFYSKTFISPCGVVSSTFEKNFLENKFHILQHTTDRFHNEDGTTNYLKERKSKFTIKNNCINLSRTIFGENVIVKLDRNLIKTGVNVARICHFFRKPIIISAHRINFCSGIYGKELRNENVDNLINLVLAIKKAIPCIKFISSDKIDEYIRLTIINQAKNSNRK